jgi:hypothetical protein
MQLGIDGHQSKKMKPSASVKGTLFRGLWIKTLLNLTALATVAAFSGKGIISGPFGSGKGKPGRLSTAIVGRKK